MAKSRKRSPRLGRGLSSLMAQPVAVDPDQAEADAPASAEATPEAAGEDTAGSKPGPARGRGAPAGEATPEPADAEPSPPAEEADDSTPATAAEGLRYVPVQQIAPNPHQPRQHFDEASLKGLADSIRQDGLMQPAVVRPVEGRGDGVAYELVAGERRWRAAQLAELPTIPAIVRRLDDQQLAEWALIENLQREDLNPIERAQAFQRLADQFSLNHDQIARRVGVERSTVSNLLRLLNLYDDVRQMVTGGLLSMGQARALAGLTDPQQQKQLAERAIKQGLSVRQVEQEVRRLATADGDTESPGSGGGAMPPQRQVRSAYLADLENQIAEQLQTKVKIRPGRKKGSGTLSIEFYSLEQFDALLEKLSVQAE